MSGFTFMSLSPTFNSQLSTLSCAADELPVASWKLSQAAVVGDDRFVAEDDAVVHRRAAPDVAVAAEDRPAHDRFLADAVVGPDNRAVEDRVLLDVALAPDDAVGADPGAGLDDGPFVDEAGRLDDRAVLDACLGRHPCGAWLGHERRRLSGDVPAVHDVAVHLHVLLRRADVDPVPAMHERDEGLLSLDQRWKETALDRP